MGAAKMDLEGEMLEWAIYIRPCGKPISIMTENSALCEMWERVCRRQLSEEEAEQWKEVERLVKQNRNVRVFLCDREAQMKFWNVTME
jgi:hypothetical protein